ERPRRHTLNWFWIESRYSYRRGDHITQVYDPGSGRYLVYPPGKVLDCRHWQNKRNHCNFVYLEMPRARAVELTRFAARLGRGTKNRLLRHGRVNQEFASRILTL